MGKGTAMVAAIVIVSLLTSTPAYAVGSTEPSSEAAEQTILRLLFDPVHDSIENYYGEPRQYMNDKILSIHKVPDAPYYEVVMQVETFWGAHNPPYGIETITFYVSYGKVELKEFEHQDESTNNY